MKADDFISMAGVYELLSDSSSATNAPSRESLLNEAVIWCQKAAQLESEGGWLFASIKLIRLLFAAGRLVQAKDAALIEGSPTSAAKYLHASVEVSDSDLLLSKAPDMTLAQAVLVTGDIATGSSFLERCGQLGFSQSWQTTLDCWREAIADGRKPPLLARSGLKTNPVYPSAALLCDSLFVSIRDAKRKRAMTCPLPFEFFVVLELKPYI